MELTGNKMKAIVCSGYGGPEVLKVSSCKRPSPGDQEVLIKIEATTVTAADIRIRSFTVPPAMWIPARLALGITRPKQKILGVELSGTVVEAGKKVRRFEVGDEVYAASLIRFGAYAEYITLMENEAIALKPKSLSFEQAAAVPIGARTALHFLRQAELKANMHVLVYGASGSVGTYAVQLAKYMGAKVTAVCGKSNIGMVAEIGADQVLDYTEPGFERQLETYDVIFVAISQISFSLCNRHLRKRGTYINVAAALKTPQMIFASLVDKKRIIPGRNVPETSEALDTIRDIIDEGKLSPVIDRTYKMDHILAAHHYVGRGHKKGNVVVQIN